jgi:hypothetical protein
VPQLFYSGMVCVLMPLGMAELQSYLRIEGAAAESSTSTLLRFAYGTSNPTICASLWFHRRQFSSSPKRLCVRVRCCSEAGRRH